MTRKLFCSLVGVGVFSVTVSAQSALPLAIDQHARISTATSTQTGRVIAVNAESVRLAVDGRDTTTIPVPSITRIDVSRVTSKASSIKKWAVRGALIAGAIGAVSLGLQHDSVGEDGSSAGKAAALGAWSGGLLGGLVGAGIGATRGGEHWQQVWP